MEITELLHRVRAGDQDALRTVVPLVYEELKKLASARLHLEGRAVSLETTALVHEAFLRLAGARHPDYESRSHFFGIASRMMRQVLVDRGRGMRKCATPGKRCGWRKSRISAGSRTRCSR